VQRETSHTIS